MSTPADPQDEALDEPRDGTYSVPSEAAGAMAWPVRILTFIAAGFMLAVGAFTFADVTGRYMFNSPIRGGVEIIEFLLGLLIFSALPLVIAKDAHITVQLFDGFMSENFKRVRTGIVLLANAAVLAFITERMWSTGAEMAEYDEISLHLQVPTAPLLFALTALSAVSVMVQLYLAIRYIAARGHVEGEGT